MAESKSKQILSLLNHSLKWGTEFLGTRGKTHGESDAALPFFMSVIQCRREQGRRIFGLGKHSPCASAA